MCMKLVIGDIDTVLGKLFAHLLIAQDTRITEILQVFFKFLTVVIDVEPHYMNISAVVFGGKFNRRDDLDILSFGGSQGFVNTVCCIMIRKSNGSQPFFYCIVDKLCGSHAAVGFG